MYNILVVDDDKEIVESIEIYLKNEGFNIFKAYNGIEALEILVEKEIHLILMDIMMPKLDGIKATIKIREEKNIPIILVSAKSEDTDKIIGLNIGADDYITKPFNLLELIARVKSNLRRYVTLGNYDNNFNKDILKSGGLELNISTKEVKVDGEVVKITPIEFKILKLLLSNKGRVFSKVLRYWICFASCAFSPFPLTSIFPTIPFRVTLSPLSAYIGKICFSPNSNEKIVNVSGVMV